jgi:hypothetical protein
MELAQTDTGNTPKSYSLNMFQDFVPMCVFSESNQGRNQICSSSPVTLCTPLSEFDLAFHISIHDQFINEKLILVQ